MFTCTFFGHKDTSKETEPILKQALIDLIENKNVIKFYVGNQGTFDYMVKRVLTELKEIYPITYDVVLAYLPGKKYFFEEENPTDTIFPDGIEKIPKRFAINYRNK